MKSICAYAVALTVLAPATWAEEIELTISASHGIQIPWVAPLQDVIVAETNKRLEAMGSENRVNWTESYGGALYSFGDTLEAVGDGITDAGWIGSLWEESKMPYDNLTYFTPFTSDDYALQMQIFNRLHHEIPALRAEWENNNVVFLGATGADTYHLYTNFPVTSIADLKGRKILAPGVTAPWMAAVGAVPVHGFCGTYGTLALALCAPESALPLKDHWAQLGVQAIGALTAFSWAFLFGLILFMTMKWMRILRVPPEYEARGLNEAEHGAKQTMLDTYDTISYMVKSGDFSRKITPEIGTEAGDIAVVFNLLVDELNDITHVAHNIAQGALGKDAMPKSERDTLGQAMASMVQRLRQFAGNLIDITGQLDHSSKELDSASGQLSRYNSALLDGGALTPWLRA